MPTKPTTPTPDPFAGPLRVTDGSLADLTPDRRNARRHDERNLAMIERSLAEVGAGRSIVLARDGTVLAGNATVDAAAAAGMERLIVVETDGHQLVAVKRRDLSPDSPEAAKLALYDNRSAELATWDAAALSLLAEELGDLGFAWTESEFEQYLHQTRQGPVGTAGLTDPDFVPEPVPEPVTRAGDLIRLGDHLLVCGDALDPETVERVVGGNGGLGGCQMLFTDPPYGLDMSRSLRDRPPTSSTGHKNYPKWQRIAGDGQDETEMAAFCRAMVAVWEGVAGAVPWYVCCNWRSYPLLYPALPEVNSLIVWVKNLWGLGAYFRHQHEFLTYTGPTLAARDESDVWDLAKGDPRDYHHPTQKPTALVQRALAISSVPGAVVLDPFAGSGSTLIACEQEGRRCAAVEIDPVYCDVIVTRWQEFTGRTAARP